MLIATAALMFLQQHDRAHTQPRNDKLNIELITDTNSKAPLSLIQTVHAVFLRTSRLKFDPWLQKIEKAEMGGKKQNRDKRRNGTNARKINQIKARWSKKKKRTTKRGKINKNKKKKV